MSRIKNIRSHLYTESKVNMVPKWLVMYVEVGNKMKQFRKILSDRLYLKKKKGIENRGRSNSSNQILS